MDTLLSPRRRRLLQAMGAAALVSGCGDWRPTASQAAAPALEFTGPTMGSSYTVKIATATLSPERQAIVRETVHDALMAVDLAMSTHRPDSELSRFNAYAATSPFALSNDSFAVFARAREVSALSGGAFDVTVGPVVDAWGFGPGRSHRIVGVDEVVALEPRVGWQMLALDDAARTVAKARPDLRADLSGIAKGHGVDLAARALDALGVGDYMIEAGGEVRVRGRNADGRPWQIAIEQPDALPQRPRLVVPLDNLAMATSGDYRIYFEQAGQRYCHEIDPATRSPIATGVASVTVVDADCARADAMATALIVLGLERGLALAAERGIAAHFIVRTADGHLVDHASPAFAALGARQLVG